MVLLYQELYQIHLMFVLLLLFLCVCVCVFLSFLLVNDHVKCHSLSLVEKRHSLGLHIDTASIVGTHFGSYVCMYLYMYVCLFRKITQPTTLVLFGVAYNQSSYRPVTRAVPLLGHLLVGQYCGLIEFFPHLSVLVLWVGSYTSYVCFVFVCVWVYVINVYQPCKWKSLHLTCCACPLANMAC